MFTVGFYPNVLVVLIVNAMMKKIATLWVTYDPLDSFRRPLAFFFKETVYLKIGTHSQEFL